jgi:hypothetical protein
MSRTRTWERWSPASGIAFVVLLIVGFMLIDIPSGDDPAQKIANFYNDGGNRAQVIIGGYLMILSGVFFFWFLASLRSRLLAAEGAPGRLTAIVFGSGLVFAAMVMLAGAVFISVAGNIAFGDEKFVSVEAARLLPEVGYPILLISGAFAGIAMIDAASVLILRTRTLPVWLAWWGFATALLLLISFLFFPILLLLLWVVFVSIALLRLEPAGVPD